MFRKYPGVRLNVQVRFLDQQCSSEHIDIFEILRWIDCSFLIRLRDFLFFSEKWYPILDYLDEERAIEKEHALRVIPRGKQRLTVYRAHQVSYGITIFFMTLHILDFH